ncbi:MAG: carboxylesterase/lipase family protein [Synergistaceae bacterium]|nr:carboxylesterase/lipase family protein [Synergistaceae bacterium]
MYLNLWKADEITEKKPVIVWIYGGAFEGGGTTDPQYDCFNLVKENPDIIVVTIAYRVSFFGFFNLARLSDGKDYTDAPNLGFMDQIMALKWVHENIKNFGGDTDNVTIWGESAGAASCTIILLIEGSHKYFKHIIAQSGTSAQTRTPEQAIEYTNKVMEALSCKTVADLRKISAEQFAETWARLYGFYQVLGI